MNHAEQAVILVAEDLENDVALIRRAFDQAGVKNPLYFVPDGEEALAYINGFGKYSNRNDYPFPDLLLLDLKMPKLDGFEVLHKIKTNPVLSSLRVVVLTSSQDIHDVNKAYHLGANSFLVKPIDFEKFPSMMRTLTAFWLRDSVAPPRLGASETAPIPKSDV